MKNTLDDIESSQHRSPGVKESGSVSSGFKDRNMRNKEPNDEERYDSSSCISASQILWSTGMLSESIPNGFYSVVPVSTLTNLMFELWILYFLSNFQISCILAQKI